MEGEVWTCEFCGCELAYDPRTRRARLSYIPKPYAAIGEAIGGSWLTRREMFERAERAEVLAAGQALPNPPPVGPLVVLVSSLTTALVILASIATALLLSPSIERTRRSISAAYQPSPTPVMVVANLETPLATPTPQPPQGGDGSRGGNAEPPAAPTQDVPLPVQSPQPPQPTVHSVEPSPTPPAVTIVVPPSPTPPPTFTPLPTLTPPVQLTLPPVVVPPSPTPTGIVNVATPEPPMQTSTPLPTATPVPPTSTPTPQPASVQIVSVRKDGTPAINEADEFVEIANTTALPVLLGRWSVRVFNEVGQLTAQYTFSDGFVIQGGQRCRIYTNLTAGENDCGLSGGFRSPIGLLSPAGGRVVLVDPAGVELQVYPF
ncbi:MAG: lamin tail domain-containing protein [Anaerolineae bacterium]|nr:lamin tail domain-containing protein [Thermoflexales bacterium]MDW8394729.1 lamin tail domain-containing protein [Anaerolineae bacterium]